MSLTFCNLPTAGALAALTEATKADKRSFVCFCEASLYSSAEHDSDVMSALQRADFVFPDGISVVWLAKLCGQPVKERVTGPGLMPAMIEYGAEHDLRHFFLGGAPGVADKLVETMMERYPRAQIVGTACPPFRQLSEAEEGELKAQIETAKPDMLWVALGSPKQEKWIAGHIDKIDVPVMLAVGAAFDFHTAERPWAPAWVRKIGMEWLFRMLTGGSRTARRNIVCVPRMLWILLKEILNPKREIRNKP
jgi:N-acetylglucosaminyldiphosphoundecaprenol N-acetyl-beta-D-mannosaminyltransferase